MIRQACSIVTGVLVMCAGSSVSAQTRPDPATLIAAQRAAMAPLAAIHGTWRGSAWTLVPSGQKVDLVQTERVGPFLEGSVVVIEGRGYEADGRLGFNAFATISYDPAARAYSIRAYAQGQVGDFHLSPTVDGYEWEIPAGPMTIHYKAVVTDSTWHEVGERRMPGKESVRFFDMQLKRLGDSSWPAAGAVGPE